ncbi:hypothetical protein QJS10_CPA08g01274 [Acorus calamus]|uniref:Pyruvate kinase n=1 Tax=Acorus calamus TaxID=4465 RepID=A0AAV9EE23_ACOCL|nr:hypothetical protein QJS10_CPA08g01274 [Acorus calamus]
MSVARFDFSWLDSEYHQETLNNLRTAVKNVKKLCAVMLDTVGPELQICNKSGNPIELKADEHVTITSDLSKDSSSEVLPVNYADLSKTVKKGDTIFLGQYLFTGSESTSAWLEVVKTEGQDVVCLVKNSATIGGYVFTMHVSQVHINLPTLTEADKKLRAFLDSQNLHDTQIFAKIENVEGLRHFDEILEEADGIILSRGNLGIDVPPEKVFLFQKRAVYNCNMAGKPAIITRVVDSMINNLRPTRAEATDVANAVLDGTDGILLGGETLRGTYPVDSIKTVGRICREAECVYNQYYHFKRILKFIGEPMSHAESVAASAVRSASKVTAAVIVVFTTSGRASRLIAKYRPPMPVFAVVVPRLKTNSLKWSFTVKAVSRSEGCLSNLGQPQRGFANDLNHNTHFSLRSSNNASNIMQVGSVTSSEESGLTLALNFGKSVGLIKPNDRAVVFQKIGDSSVFKIIELNDS